MKCYWRGTTFRVRVCLGAVTLVFGLLLGAFDGEHYVVDASEVEEEPQAVELGEPGDDEASPAPIRRAFPQQGTVSSPVSADQRQDKDAYPGVEINDGRETPTPKRSKYWEDFSQYSGDQSSVKAGVTSPNSYHTDIDPGAGKETPTPTRRPFQRRLPWPFGDDNARTGEATEPYRNDLDPGSGKDTPTPTRRPIPPVEGSNESGAAPADDTHEGA